MRRAGSSPLPARPFARGRRRRTLVGLSALLACTAAFVGCGSAERDMESELRTVVEEFLAENPVAPGVVVHVIAPAAGLDVSIAAGRAARGSAEPLTGQHTFRIASNTKTYVAAAVLRLVEQERLTLDDPLSRHLDDVERELLAGDGYDLETISIRHVLAHTAGLADHTTGDRYTQAILADPTREWTRVEQVRACVEWFDPMDRPGARFVYSDTGYVLLGGIVERLAGQRLGAAVRDLLDYRSLGLQATWWEYLEDPPAGAGPRAHQYLGDFDATRTHASYDLHGGGGIVSNARDMAHFMRALLNGRVFEQEATLARMKDSGTETYRLGLMVSEFAGHTAYGHAGFWNTFAHHVPSLDVTVSGSILNHEAAKGHKLAERLVAALAR